MIWASAGPPPASMLAISAPPLTFVIQSPNNVNPKPAINWVALPAKNALTTNVWLIPLIVGIVLIADTISYA